MLYNKQSRAKHGKHIHATLTVHNLMLSEFQLEKTKCIHKMRPADIKMP